MHALTECQTCRNFLASHTVCKACGYYKGTKILRTKTDRMNERGQAKLAKYATQAPEAAAE